MNGFAMDKLLVLFFCKHFSYEKQIKQDKTKHHNSAVFLVAGIWGIPRNSSPVYVSGIEAVRTHGDWMENPGDPFPSSGLALLFLCADPQDKQKPLISKGSRKTEFYISPICFSRHIKIFLLRAFYMSKLNTE